MKPLPLHRVPIRLSTALSSNLAKEIEMSPKEIHDANGALAWREAIADATTKFFALHANEIDDTVDPAIVDYVSLKMMELALRLQEEGQRDNG